MGEGCRGSLQIDTLAKPGEGCAGMQSGRPRKPLAEVILRSAPLRATSSGQCISIWHAVHKPFKTQVVGTFDSVGIAHSEKELLRLHATKEDALALQPR